MKKAKIISCTGGFRNISLEETLFILKELGFRYIEGTTDGRAHLYPYIFGGEDPKQLKELFSKNKLKLIAVSGGWSDFAAADSYIEKQYASLRKQFHFCRQFGVKILRVFASHLPGQYLDKNIIKRIITNIKRIMPEAEKNNICLAMENHYGVTGRVDDILRIIEGVAHPNLKINFDAANFIPVKESPVEACKKLIPYIVHLHLKDIRIIGKPNEGAYLTGRDIHQGYEFCEIGAGNVNYPKILSILSENNYKGAYSIEYENFSDAARGTLISRHNLKKIFSKLNINC